MTSLPRSSVSMDKIDKFTSKLKHNLAVKVLEALKDIRAGNTTRLDVSKLKGEESTYRARLGSIRIQFMKTSVGNIVTKIGFKGDTTYR